MLISLTSKCLFLPSWDGPRMALCHIGDTIWHKVGRGEKVVMEPVAEAPPELIVFPQLTFQTQHTPTREASWEFYRLALRCLKFLEQKDWKGMGETMDAIWLLERFVEPPGAEFDTAYARIRNAGAWGGHPCTQGMAVLCPVEKQEQCKPLV